MSKGTLIYDCPMYGMKSGDEIEMVNFDNLLKLTQQADALVAQLETEDNMCKIADIIHDMDKDMLERVLKKFVYKSR